MKRKLFISVLFCSLTNFSNAQSDIEQENKNKWGGAIAINSIHGQMGFPGITAFDLDENGNLTSGSNRISKSVSLSIIPKYYINNNLLIRFELGKTNINQQGNADYSQSGVHYISKNAVKETIMRFVPAMQYNLFKQKFFEAYSGMSVIYVNYGKYFDNSSAEFRDSGTNVLTFQEEINNTIDGGFATGIGALVGSNIYLQKHVSLGAEFSSSFLYYKVGGKYIYNQVDQSLPNPPVRTLDNQTLTYKGFRFSNILSSFNISIWL